MASFTRLFGDKPRVRLLEGLLELAPVAFTRGELAREAGLRRMSANRNFPELEDDGFVVQVEGGPTPKYRVNEANPYVQVLSHLDGALGLLDRARNSEADDVLEAFRRSLFQAMAPTPRVDEVRSDTGGTGDGRTLVVSLDDRLVRTSAVETTHSP